ncbi:MAG: hypothetical protein U0031_16440 [Thermomicrobiales bacterium]
MGKMMASSWQMFLGIALILATGLIHLAETQEYFGEVKYIGALFALSVVGSVISAVGIARGERWGWTLGVLVAGGSLVGYLLSRTIGIPMFRENSWEEFSEPMGLLSLAVEALFLIVAGMVYTGQSRAVEAGAPAD